MRKALNGLLYIILLIAMCFLLQSCNINGQNKEDIADVDKDSGTFFNLENFNYNSSYTSQAENEKGFLIYDDIDFNSVTFNSSIVDVDSICFDVWHSGEKLKTITKQLRSGFESYRADKNGEYTIEVTAQKIKGEQVKGSFKFNVVSNGRPDSVQFTIKNSKGETVDKVKGGDSYIFSAKVYSDGEEITLNKEDFYWEKPANAGEYEYRYIADNVVKEQSKKFDFYCFAINNNGEKINIADNTFDEADNLLKTEAFPEGIYYDYGIDINSKVTLDVNSAHSSYFYKGITANYCFDNGETREIEISDRHEEGKFSLFISYDKENHSVYSLNKYDYSIDPSGNKIINYFDNGVKYQFDPTKDSVNVYLAIWHKRKSEIGYTLFPEKIDSSVLDIDLSGRAPDTFEIAAVVGSHKKDTVLFSNEYKSFNKNIIDGIVDLYVCCDMDGDGRIDDEYYGKTLSNIKQFFMLNVVADTGSLWDYTMEVVFSGVSRPILSQVYQNAALGIFDRYFVCPEVGTAQITIRSKFSDKVSTVTVNVVDKIFENDKLIDGDSLSDYFVFSKVDFSQIIKIKEYRLSSYNKNNYYLRGLKEGETLEYLRDNTVIDPNNFCYGNNGTEGQKIVVRIAGTNITREVTKVYIIPKFAFYINDKYFLTEQLDTKYYVERLTSETYPYPKKDFYGTTPIMDFYKGDEEINYNSFVLHEEYGDKEGEPSEFSYYFYRNVFTIKYKFAHRLAGVTNIYEAQILAVYIK